MSEQQQNIAVLEKLIVQGQSMVDGATQELSNRRRNRFLRVAAFLLVIAVVLALIGFDWRGKNMEFESNLLLGFATEIAGALLTFIILDFLWQRGEKEHEMHMEFVRRIADLKGKAEWMNNLQKQAATEGNTNPDIDAELREIGIELKREIPAVLALYDFFYGKPPKDATTTLK